MRMVTEENNASLDGTEESVSNVGNEREKRASRVVTRDREIQSADTVLSKQMYSTRILRDF